MGRGNKNLKKGWENVGKLVGTLKRGGFTNYAHGI